MASDEKSDDSTSNAVGLPSGQDEVPDTSAEPREGGWFAWLQVVGAFCVYLNTWLVQPSPPPPRGARRGVVRRPLFVTNVDVSYCRGMLNSFGVFQTYYELNALSSQSAFTISWIGSTQSAIFFVATLIVGPLFDLGYFRSLLWVGTALLVVSMFLLSVTSQFYQVLLTQSVLFGFGAGCVFLPAPAVVAQYFDARLGLAISIASVGSAIGKGRYPVLFPLTKVNK